MSNSPLLSLLLHLSSQRMQFLFFKPRLTPAIHGEIILKSNKNKTNKQTNEKKKKKKKGRKKKKKRNK